MFDLMVMVGIVECWSVCFDGVCVVGDLYGWIKGFVLFVWLLMLVFV